MTDTDIYQFVGDHAETLASGRRVAPGDLIPANALSDDPVDQRLLTSRMLVECATPEEPAAPSTTTPKEKK